MDDHGRAKVLLELIESPSKLLPLKFCIANLWTSQTCIEIVTLKIATLEIFHCEFVGFPDVY